ncbi:MAG: DUF6677 family protein [Planctomycetota bacterium]
MDPASRMTRRERLMRLFGGVGMVALGFAVFAISKAYDPQNRAALLGIVAVFIGLTWVGQAARGHKEIVVHHEEEPASEPVPAHLATLGMLAAWAVPGLGHFLIGRKKKAILYFVTIAATFLLGVVLAQGRNLSYERDAVYFLAYMWNGALTGLGWLATRGLENDHPIPLLQVGFLYTAVACLLNLVVLVDFINACARRPEAAKA